MRLQALFFLFLGYESQFDKKAFAEELELSEIVNFFRECDLYPSNAEIDEGIDVIFQGKTGTKLAQNFREK